MRNIFSYDSILMRFLSDLFDIVLLSLIFVLCSLPLFTVGAAQAGLASAIHAKRSGKSGTTPYRAFFKGFSSGFGKITIIWLCCLISVCCVLYLFANAMMADSELNLVFWVFTVFIAIGAIMIQTMSAFMHSRFDCTFLDLIKNSLLMVITYPLRAFAMGLFVWAPLFFALAEPYVFLAFSPFFVFFYYGLSFMLCYHLIRKPFQKIQDIYFPKEEHK